MQAGASTLMKAPPFLWLSAASKLRQLLKGKLIGQLQKS